MVTLNGQGADYRGLSTDEKPTNTETNKSVAENALFLEVDTGDFYAFSGGSWAKVGA